MPKRSYSEDKIAKYQRKIRRLEEEQANRRRRRIICSSESEENSDEDAEVYPPDNENLENEGDNELLEAESTPSKDDIPLQDKTGDDIAIADDLPVVLDTEILCALGESTEDTPKFGDKIHDNLAQLWTPVLRKGLNKDLKDKLTKQFLVPENCPLLQAPKLNPEIVSAVNETSRARDKKIEASQQQLGLGITALNRALTLLVNSDNSKLEAIKLMSESCRILCDLHYEKTQTRIKCISPGLDKSFMNVVQDVERDDMLFGNKLSDKIKASKVIEKQGLQIKKPAPAPKPTPSTSTSYSTMSRPRPQGNWMGPPRFPTNRGGRGGLRKTFPATTTNRRAPSSNQKTSHNSTHQGRTHRAPTQQL